MIFFFLGEPSRTRILLQESDGFRTFTFIRKHVFCINFYIGNHVMLVMFCNGFVVNNQLFHVFLSIDFWRRFFIMFLTEKTSKMTPKQVGSKGLFFKLFRESIFGDILASFWHGLFLARLFAALFVGLVAGFLAGWLAGLLAGFFAGLLAGLFAGLLAVLLDGLLAGLLAVCLLDCLLDCWLDCLPNCLLDCLLDCWLDCLLNCLLD